VESDAEVPRHFARLVTVVVDHYRNQKGFEAFVAETPFCNPVAGLVTELDGVADSSDLCFLKTLLSRSNCYAVVADKEDVMVEMHYSIVAEAEEAGKQQEVFGKLRCNQDLCAGKALKTADKKQLLGGYTAAEVEVDTVSLRSVVEDWIESIGYKAGAEVPHDHIGEVVRCMAEGCCNDIAELVRRSSAMMADMKVEVGLVADMAGVQLLGYHIAGRQVEEEQYLYSCY
jgi:hypothetical protein